MKKPLLALFIISMMSVTPSHSQTLRELQNQQQEVRDTKRDAARRISKEVVCPDAIKSTKNQFMFHGKEWQHQQRVYLREDGYIVSTSRWHRFKNEWEEWKCWGVTGRLDRQEKTPSGGRQIWHMENGSLVHYFTMIVFNEETDVIKHIYKKWAPLD